MATFAQLWRSLSNYGCPPVVRVSPDSALLADQMSPAHFADPHFLPSFLRFLLFKIFPYFSCFRTFVFS